MKIHQQFPDSLADVKLTDISTSELWVIKEQYENDMIPVMYGPMELHNTSYNLYLIGSGTQIYGITVGITHIVGLSKINNRHASQIIMREERRARALTEHIFNIK